MKSIKIIVICLFILSCSNDNNDILEQTLSAYVQGRTTELGSVIACAASAKDSESILTFYYPEKGAVNIRLYETKSADFNPDDFENYNLVTVKSEPFFNGHLGKYKHSAVDEKWIIVTFELDNEIKVSNPIRSKQMTKPTLWNDEVVIVETPPSMPVFRWEDNAVGDNAIYFQVISDSQNNLLSGTYTYENLFQYYKTDNVILNVTTQTPPDLVPKASYNFTLMDVSSDNWVNWVIQKPFEAQ